MVWKKKSKDVKINPNRSPPNRWKWCQKWWKRCHKWWKRCKKRCQKWCQKRRKKRWRNSLQNSIGYNSLQFYGLTSTVLPGHQIIVERLKDLLQVRVKLCWSEWVRWGWWLTVVLRKYWHWEYVLSYRLRRWISFRSQVIGCNGRVTRSHQFWWICCTVVFTENDRIK